MIDDIDPGEMRVDVVYEDESVVRLTKTRSEVKEWAALWTGKAAVRPLSAKEVYYAGGMEARVSHRITIRYRPDVRKGGRFRIYGTARVLWAVGVRDVEERRRWLVVDALESPDRPS